MKKGSTFPVIEHPHSGRTVDQSWRRLRIWDPEKAHVGSNSAVNSPISLLRIELRSRVPYQKAGDSFVSLDCRGRKVSRLSQANRSHSLSFLYLLFLFLFHSSLLTSKVSFFDSVSLVPMKQDLQFDFRIESRADFYSNLSSFTLSLSLFSNL